MYLGNGNIPCISFCSENKRALIIIGYIAELLRHTAGKNTVRRRKYFFSGTEILAQKDLSGLMRTGSGFQRVRAIFLIKDFRICKPEPINSLLNIPNHKKSAPATGNCIEDSFLHTADILIFIDHYFSVA